MEQPRHDIADDTRDETPDERADRNWTDLLQEFRVLQTGVQLLSGFLLTLPFHNSFGDLDGFQRNTYLALVLLAATTTACVLAPISVHRRIFRQRRKERLVQFGHRLARVVLGLTGALLAGTTFFIFDVVLARAEALVVGGVMLALVTTALLVAPLAMGPAPATHDDSD